MISREAEDHVGLDAAVGLRNSVDLHGSASNEVGGDGGLSGGGGDIDRADRAYIARAVDLGRRACPSPTMVLRAMGTACVPPGTVIVRVPLE